MLSGPVRVQPEIKYLGWENRSFEPENQLYALMYLVLFSTPVQSVRLHCCPWLRYVAEVVVLVTTLGAKRVEYNAGKRARDSWVGCNARGEDELVTTRLCRC